MFRSKRGEGKGIQWSSLTDIGKGEDFEVGIRNNAKCIE